MKTKGTIAEMKDLLRVGQEVIFYYQYYVGDDYHMFTGNIKSMNSYGFYTSNNNTNFFNFYNIKEIEILNDPQKEQSEDKKCNNCTYKSHCVEDKSKICYMFTKKESVMEEKKYQCTICGMPKHKIEDSCACKGSLPTEEKKKEVEVVEKSKNIEINISESSAFLPYSIDVEITHDKRIKIISDLREEIFDKDKINCYIKLLQKAVEIAEEK